MFSIVLVVIESNRLKNLGYFKFAVFNVPGLQTYALFCSFLSELYIVAVVNYRNFTKASSVLTPHLFGSHRINCYSFTDWRQTFLYMESF